jgi:hypothetical protein
MEVLEMKKAEAVKYRETAQENRGLWIHTFANNKFYAFDPRPEEISIEDIAHALALTCRFSGHCNTHYSVAQHSVLVSKLVPEEFALEGLLHDAPEAYLTDVPRPIKHMLNDQMDGLWTATEDRLYAVIAKKFGALEVLPEAVHDVDYNIVADEASVLFVPIPDWVEWYELLGVDIEPMGWEEAEQAFLERFKELTNG